MSILQKLSVVVFVACFATELQAGVIVSFSPTSPLTIVAGDTATVDVLVASDSSDTLDIFLTEFLITPVSGDADGLRFALAQDYSYLHDGNYVFQGVSGAYLRWLPPGNSEPGAVAPNQLSYSVGDFTDDGTSLPLRGNSLPVTLSFTPLLLARLAVETTAGMTGTYRLDLSSDPSHTEFVDGGNMTLAFDSDPLDIVVTSSLSSVPEPPVFPCLLIAAALVLQWRRASSRRQAACSQLA